MAQEQIRVLPPRIVNQIAAGEVVERPASVLKELIENSIDAGATEINVTLNKGGLQLIEVSDNGTGMNRQNASLVLTQHATSKIFTEADLSHITTMGFRGEALASISSVAEIAIHTYDGKSQPVSVQNKDKTVMVSLAAGRKRGTTISVRNIFQAIPARRKFLRSESTEYKYLLETFIAAALSHPQLGFSLNKDRKQVMALNPATAITERISQIFPDQLKDKQIELNYQDAELKVTGIVGHPSLARNYSYLQYLFLNYRPVRDNLLAKAVKEGFSSSLLKGYFPVYFIYLELMPEILLQLFFQGITYTLLDCYKDFLRI